MRSVFVGWKYQSDYAATVWTMQTELSKSAVWSTPLLWDTMHSVETDQGMVNVAQIQVLYLAMTSLEIDLSKMT